MKLIIAVIYSNYETFVVNDEGIEARDDFVAGPVGGKLILGFERI
jgi:hypothetical protein